MSSPRSARCCMRTRRPARRSRKPAASRVDGMPVPQTPYEAVLHAARDVVKLDNAFDAEMLGGALLGSVYAVASEDRAGAVRSFVSRFLTSTARRRTPAAAA